MGAPLYSDRAWRRKRDLVIAVVWGTGRYTHRKLADVFGLSRQAVGKILAKQRARVLEKWPPDP